MQSIVVAIVGALSAAVGGGWQAWRSRRRETVDIAAQWQQTYGALLEQVATLRTQLETSGS